MRPAWQRAASITIGVQNQQTVRMLEDQAALLFYTSPGLHGPETDTDDHEVVSIDTTTGILQRKY